MVDPRVICENVRLLGGGQILNFMAVVVLKFRE
jgi:hypothetical protein